MIDNYFEQYDYLGITFYPTVFKGQTIKVYVDAKSEKFTVDKISNYIIDCLQSNSNQPFDMDFTEDLSIAHTSKVRRVIIPNEVLRTTLISFSYE